MNMTKEHYSKLAELERNRFRIGDGYVSTPIFVRKENNSTYYDIDIEEQVCISLGD